MYDLFSDRDIVRSGRMTYPDLPRVRRDYLERIDEVKEYYRLNPKRFDNQNLLVRLLNALHIRMDLDDYEFIYHIEESMHSATRTLGLTSPLYRGKIHTGGVTLGPLSDEVILIDTSKFDFEFASEKWPEYEPYKYLYHSRVDVGLPIMNNTTAGKAYGVGLLNVPMLALQYRHWFKRQGEQPEPISQFVARFVLPKTLPRFHDIAIFNRLARTAKGIGMPKFSSPHPFYVPDYSDRLDKLVGFTLDKALRRARRITDVLASVSLVWDDTLRELIDLPDDPINRNNEWAYIIALLPYLRFAVTYGLEHGIFDRTQVNEVTMTLREALRDRTLDVFNNTLVEQTHLNWMNELLEKMTGYK